MTPSLGYVDRQQAKHLPEVVVPSVDLQFIRLWGITALQASRDRAFFSYHFCLVVTYHVGGTTLQRTTCKEL